MLIDRKYDLARRWSNTELRQIAPLFAGDIANVSGWDDRDKQGDYYRNYFTNARRYVRTNYRGHCGLQGTPDEIELDLTASMPPELHRSFDTVFNHTTLEHIFDIRTAFANLCELSRDAVIVVVPFSQVQHESADWGDYWRFTPSCLRRLFSDAGLQVIYEAESPHRRSAIYLLFVASRNPESYSGRLPPHRPISAAGHWIGSNYLISGFQFAQNRLRRALGLKSPYE